MEHKILFVFIAVLVPLMLFVNAWQAYRYQQEEKAVRYYEECQQELLEKNKKIVARISVLSSPERIEKLAKEELGLRQYKAEDILRIKKDEGGLKP